MCSHTQAQADALQAEANNKKSEKDSILTEKNKMMALNNTYDECIEKFNCVSNELNGMSVVAGEAYDKGVPQQCKDEIKKEIDNWKEIMNEADKSMMTLDTEIANLERTAASLRGTDCDACKVREDEWQYKWR